MVGYRRACASLVASFAAGARTAHRCRRRTASADAKRSSSPSGSAARACHKAAARTDNTSLHLALIATSVALRPRLTARSPMSGAAWPAMEVKGNPVNRSGGRQRAVRAPGRIDRRGRCGELTDATAHALHPCACIPAFHRDAPARCARSPMSGASFPRLPKGRNTSLHETRPADNTPYVLAPHTFDG
jgi:hypothetical protein